jgi:hypothetical protein
MIKLPYGWDSAVQAAKEANGNGSINNMQIAASIILELDSQLRSPAQTKTVADAVEQEGEKWTHTWGESKCRIIATDETKDEAWVKFELTGNNGIVVLSGLKPIKPTISKAEAWDLCQDYEGSQSIVKYMLELHEQYDII